MLAIALMSCAAFAESEPVTIEIKGAIDITAKLPEGYTLNVTKESNVNVLGTITSEDATKPEILIGLSYDELFEGKTLNDLTKEEKELLIDESAQMFLNPTVYEQTTDHGTPVIALYENSEDNSQIDVFSLWNGYFVEMVITAKEDYPLTEDQLEIARQLISDMWLRENTEQAADGEDVVTITHEYHGVGAEDSWF